jgi:ABC-type amino acid transport substrate-binding protein
MSAQRPVAATFTAFAVLAVAGAGRLHVVRVRAHPVTAVVGQRDGEPVHQRDHRSTHVNQRIESYTPPAAVPTNLSGYPTVDKIRTRGRLIVGGSATSMLLAARNPISGRIEGFDVDLAR